MPLIIKTPLMPKGICLNLFGMYLARDTSWIDEKVINHERIHDAQQREMAYVGFYLAYVIEWLWRLIRLRSWWKAYRAISFEREAYTNGDDLGYLRRRKHYAWRHYLRSERPFR